MIALLALLAACKPEAPPPAQAPLVVEGASLSLGQGAVLHMAQATVARDGSGQGQEAQLTAPGPPPLQVDAPRSEWDLRKREARFEGGVTATRGDVTLRADRLVLSFQSPERVERAIAEGAVRVRQGDRSAEGDRAELSADSGEIVLTGSPSLSEGGNRMSGSRITVWLDDERVACDDCRLVVAGDAVAPR